MFFFARLLVFSISVTPYFNRFIISAYHKKNERLINFFGLRERKMALTLKREIFKQQPKQKKKTQKIAEE